MQKYINQMIQYMNYLENTFQLQISVHDFGSIAGPFTSALFPFRMHRNPYCVQLKNRKDVWEGCIRHQEKVCKELENNILFGMCPWGVEEYVVPIKCRETIMGFISVSGYRCDREKAMEKISKQANRYHQNSKIIKENYVPIKCRETIMGFISVSGYRCDREKAMEKISKQANRYHQNSKIIKENYERYLRNTILEKQKVEILITPLAAMLELLYIRQQEIYPHLHVQQNQEDHSVLNKIQNYLERFYREPITIDDLCVFCNCSRSYISHIFKRNMGQNVNQYINALRIHEAQILLRHTKLSITEIALSVGFSSSNYFSNVFREICGESPSVYRKSQ